MTIPSTTRKAGPLLGTGAQTAWPFTFKVFAEADIRVVIVDSLAVETDLVLDTDYSVALNANQDTSPGGTVTYPLSGSPLATGSALTIVGDLDYDQPYDVPTGGNFNPTALENELDRIVMQAQQLREILNRALLAPVTSAASGQLPAPEANTLIGWNSAENALQNVPLSDIVTAQSYGSYTNDSFTGDGSDTTFALSSDPVTLANLMVIVDGMVLTPATDFTLASGSVIFTVAPTVGAEIVVRYGQALVATGMAAGDVSFTPTGNIAAVTVQAALAELDTDKVATSAIGVTVQAYDADTPTVAASQAEMEAGTETAIRSMSPLRIVQAIAALTNLAPPVRQTVLSGPVDTSGFSAFGGSTGTTTVTAAGVLVATAANGVGNRTGSITNPSWSGLSTNGTMYLYLDIAAGGACTAGSTTVEPSYRWGGADVTTNNQFTFNIQEMVGKVGNGSTAAQTYRVFVGQVTVSGSVVSAITWYALMGRYDSGYTATLPAAAAYTSKNHNIGTDTVTGLLLAKCTTTDAGYSVGQICTPVPNTANPGINNPVDRLTVGAQAGAAGSGWGLVQRAGGNVTNLTAANWSYKIVAQRTW